MSCTAAFRGSTLAVRILCVLGLLAGLPTGFNASKAGSCKTLCTGVPCVAVHHDAVDSGEAKKRCIEAGGELLTLQPPTAETLLELLQREKPEGSLWIGLSLLTNCSDLCAPLRSYEWIGAAHGDFTPRSIEWKQSRKVCAPHCVALSAGARLWTELPCKDAADGFLCWGSCPTKPSVFPGRCADAPCKDTCVDVVDGYTCGCQLGFAPDPADPKQCKPHCAAPRCKAKCLHGSCDCADGYILSDDFCEDIDECENNYCDQLCHNTHGSFKCTCKAGFELVDQYKCVIAPKLSGTTELSSTSELSGTSELSSTSELSGKTLCPTDSASPDGFPWAWALAAAVASAAAFV